MAIDDLIDYIRPYNPLPIYLHGYAGPFLVLYGVVFAAWYGLYGLYDYFEAGCIAMIIVGLLQILVVLFCHWFVSVRCFMTCSYIKDPKRARLVRVTPCPNQGYEELVPLRTRIDANDGEILWFEFQKVTYIYDVDEKKQFSSVEMDLSRSLEHYMSWKGHETDDDVAVAAIRHGDNQMEMVIPDFVDLFKERATAPFFVFQVFCVGLWCLDEYWYYSIFTLAMLVAFEATLVKQQLRNMAEIRNMGNKPYMMQVFRSRRWRPVISNELVPGDIVSIGRSVNDNLVPCDLLLLRGPCIVDESMLTGESVPQMKEPIEELDMDQMLDVETDGKLHLLFGGTKVVQHSPPSKTGPGMKSPDNGCVCYVLRTGFTTSQGKLLRTILFGVKRVTANNLETFGFILFLLIFAVAAASYVWIKGTEDASRSRYKLFIECALILTSVVPPELPIELSLAVNNSLLALAKLGVYCTEPFRIPFAGKVKICCFDKTGTLTTDNLVVQGIAGLPDFDEEIVPLSEAPSESVQVLVSCHSLVQLESGEMVGDPLEKACLSSADWSLTKNDTVIPRHSKELPLRIFHRHHFSSALKRMSAVVGYMPHGTSDVVHLAVAKGAPETLKQMFSNCPSDYDTVYTDITRQGARVLALGFKELGPLTHQEIRDLGRDNIECDLTFAGFVVVSCPLKPDTKTMIKEIINSSHQVVMITGDNPLTACHVAKELRMTDKKRHTLILEDSSPAIPEWHWQSVDESVALPLSYRSRDLKELTESYDLCVTGQGISYLLSENPQFLSNLLPSVSVFARVAPKQKELVITSLKAKGCHTLMCGDGTNDVGALKHADVGVALLSHPLPLKKSAASAASVAESGDKASNSSPSSSERSTAQLRPSGSTDGPPGKRKLVGRRGPGMDENSRTNKIAQQQKKHLEKLNSVLKELEEEEKAQIVKLGDASIAAPFTSKLSSIQCICHVIKQGRCTLVTTLQMFKILALNALVLAYSQSVLYLDGVKFSDSQATIQGLLLAACFLFISRSKPLKVLSRQRPLTNVFNLYTLLSVCLQFSVHFFCMTKLVGEAHDISASNVTQPVNLEETFKPNLVNTTVYILSVTLQVATFAVNYRGHPFMESLWENKALLYSLITSGGFVVSLAAGFLPDVAEQFELIPLPDEFRTTVLYTLLLDLTACYAIDRVLLFLLGDWRIRS